jgi:hypothetical protein
MTIMVLTNAPMWICIGAGGISGGCATDCSTGDNPPCPVPNTEIADLMHGDHIGGPVPFDVGEAGAELSQAVNREACTRAHELCLLRLRQLAGPAGEAFFEHFLNGGGGAITHDTDSPMAEMIRTTYEYQSQHNDVQDAITERIRQQAPTTATSFDLELESVPWFDWWRQPRRLDRRQIEEAVRTLMHIREALDEDGHITVRTILAALVGGTKGCKVFIRNLNVNRSTHTWTADLRYRICDHFGVDTSDFYADGLIALWILQHCCPGPQRPFTQTIYVEEHVARSYQQGS